MQNVKCKMQSAKCKVQNAKCKMHVLVRTEMSFFHFLILRLQQILQ